MQDGPFPTFPAYTRQSSRKARAFLFVALFIGVIAIAILGGNFFLSSQGQSNEKSQAVLPTPTPLREGVGEASPTATLTPVEEELDPSELSVQALNGSGTGGAAGILSDVLEKAGYTVSGTGNADRFDYTETVIQIKQSSRSYTERLSEDLSTDYEVSEKVETLAESARYDAIVIVGEN